MSVVTEKCVDKILKSRNSPFKGVISKASSPNPYKTETTVEHVAQTTLKQQTKYITLSLSGLFSISSSKNDGSASICLSDVKALTLMGRWCPSLSVPLVWQLPTITAGNGVSSCLLSENVSLSNITIRSKQHLSKKWKKRHCCK